MNKVISKKIFLKNNIKTPKYFSFNKNNFQSNLIKKFIMKNKINFPVVLKPVNEGSSLGVEICKNFKKLFSSINFLFKKI